MSTKQEFYYPSADKKTQIHAECWIPDGEPKAVLQICHGMTEYVGRYEEFALFLNKHGFVVIGNDHLGHGQSVVDRSCYGYFAETDGNACLLQDIHTLRCRAVGVFPKLPYFILGHSMGSFLTRQYISQHGEKLDGAIIMGTGTYSPALMAFARALCALTASFKGQKYVSRRVTQMSMSSNNKRIEKPQTKSDWLTRDAAVVEKYRHDPLCRIKFTVNGYGNMFYSIDNCQKKSVIAQIPKDLPMLIISGEEDSVGNYGKGVRKAYQKYVDAGISDVDLKLYPEDRHEILNELDKEQVYEDILNWLDSKLH